VTAMMMGFPLLMYYLWICCWFYDGNLVHPNSVDEVVPFLKEMWGHVRVVSTPLNLHSRN
jgi:delta24(24(1))-sterol reductase